MGSHVSILTTIGVSLSEPHIGVMVMFMINCDIKRDIKWSVKLTTHIIQLLSIAMLPEVCIMVCITINY